jgi:hypothetical protein
MMPVVATGWLALLLGLDGWTHAMVGVARTAM